MKQIILILVFLNIFTHQVFSQEDAETQTHEVVTAEGRKTVDIEQANKDVTDKLKRLKEENKERIEEKRDKKRIAKIAGRIVFGAILLGGIIYWRNRKRKAS